MVNRLQFPRGGRLRWAVAALALAVALLSGLLALQSRHTAAATAPIAPDFTLPITAGTGSPFSLDALRGHPVLLSFYSSQCADCLAQLPVLRQADRTFRASGLRVVGVATGGDTLASARALAAAAHLSFTVAVDAQQSGSWSYDVGTLPTSFFIDAQGRLQAQWIGPLDASMVRDGLAQVNVLSCTACSPLMPPSLVADQPAAGSAPAVDADVVYKPPRGSPQFALRDQNGTLTTPARFRGKVVALTFVSALCKEQCPLVGKALTLVRQQLGQDASKLSIVAISVEPEVDTPHATQQFARDAGWLGADWHYLTAARPVLSRIWRAYGVDVAAPPPIFKPDVSVVHQADLFIVDPQGRLRAYYDVPFLPSRVVTTIRALL